jgi:hypothetical protein
MQPFLIARTIAADRRRATTLLLLRHTGDQLIECLSQGHNIDCASQTSPHTDSASAFPYTDEKRRRAVNGKRTRFPDVGRNPFGNLSINARLERGAIQANPTCVSQ